MAQQLIHKTYRDILAEISAESKTRQDLGNQTKNRAETERIEDIIYFPKSRQKAEKPFLAVTIGFLICFLIIGGIFLLDLLKAAPKYQPFSDILPAPTQVIPTVRAEDINLVNDVKLIKKILTGLVQSVQVLSEEKEKFKPKQNFPYPVKIISEKANLRSSPDLDAKSLGVVSKGTILLATSESSGWLKVSTPKGEEAWVSQNIVAAKEE